MIHPLVRFHALGGARVAQRNALLLIGATIVLLTAKPTSARELLRQIVLSLAAVDVPAGAALFVALLAGAIAANAVPTLTAGLGGWIRSLSFSGITHRRAVTAALVIPTLPILALEVMAIILAPTVFDQTLSGSKIAGLPLALLAVAIFATPSRTIARLLGVLAVWLSSLGRWDAILAAIVAIAVADATAGPLALSSRRAQRVTSSSARIALRISLRALGWPSLASLIPVLILLGFAHLYRVNNELSVADAASVLRGCALIGITFLLASLADRLIVRRPPWPWARSLPVGSRRRVLEDGRLLAAACALPLIITLWLDWRSALFVLVVTPLLIAQTTGAIRRGTGRMTRAAGEILLLGIVATIIAIVWPLSALVALALVPFVMTASEGADRRLSGTAWSELHHSTGGDSLAVGIR